MFLGPSLGASAGSARAVPRSEAPQFQGISPEVRTRHRMPQPGRGVHLRGESGSRAPVPGDLWRNDDARRYALGRAVLEGRHAWLDADSALSPSPETTCGPAYPVPTRALAGAPAGGERAASAAQDRAGGVASGARPA